MDSGLLVQLVQQMEMPFEIIRQIWKIPVKNVRAPEAGDLSLIIVSIVQMVLYVVTNVVGKDKCVNVVVLLIRIHIPVYPH